MNLLSGPVLGAAALVASPALWASLVTGTLPLDAALGRYLAAVVVCWIALSLVTAMVGAAPAPAPVEPDPRPEDPRAHEGEPGILG